MPYYSKAPGKAALALRLAGASYTEIAETVGYADSVTARQAIVRELSTYESDEESRERLRSEEGARIERLLVGVWQKATDPRSPEHLSAVKVALSLIDRHSRLLGLDAPQEVVVHNPTAAEIDQWVASVIEESRALTDIVEAEIVGETS